MTPEQEKTHFDTFGFIVKRELFQPDEMEAMSRWFDEGFANYHGELGKEKQFIEPGLQLHPGLCESYLDDPRILDALENLIGEGCVLCASDAQRTVGNSKWHHDSTIPMEEGRPDEYVMLKVQMYFEDLKRGRGCLSVLPGSHKKGYGEALRAVWKIESPIDPQTPTPMGATPPEMPGALPIETRPGDIIFFNQKLGHSSWGGPRGRRFLGLTFGEKPTKGWHHEWLIHHADRWQKACMNEAKTQFPEHLVKNAGPRLKKAIEYLHSKGY